MEKREINLKLKELDDAIKKHENRVEEIESSFTSRLFSKKELSDLKAQIEDLKKQRNELINALGEIYNQEKKAIKQKACQELIELVTGLETIQDTEGKVTTLPEDVKLSFLELLKSYQSSDQLYYTYNYEETDDYSIRDELYPNSKGKIEIRVTTNDFGIAAKSHDHIEDINAMIARYIKYLESKQAEKGETNKL